MISNGVVTIYCQWKNFLLLFLNFDKIWIMLYELSHFIKEHLRFVWDVVEWGNAEAFSLIHKQGLKDISAILEKCSTGEFSVRMTLKEDVEGLVSFFEEQPKEAFTFFKPHGFEAKSLGKVLRNKSFLTFVVTANETIVGYFFLRCFVNGKSFKGYIVDHRQRGKGIAKLQGVAMNLITEHLGLRMYASISPENVSSLAVARSVNDIKIIKTLENGYYLIECSPKHQELEGGVDNVL